MGKLANKINSIVGNNIRKQRIVQEISQDQLAYETGITREYINKIESGKYNITLKKLALICEALNISPKKLFD